MKNLFLILLLTSSNIFFGQKIISGEYELGLKLSYDISNNMLTGYFEGYTGWDEQTQSSQFSCIFYIEGKVTGNKFNVKTYYPQDKKEDLISGTLEIVNSKTIKIKLPEEHGGCWNVMHFVDNPKFDLEKKFSWIQIRYVDKAKAYFYKNKSDQNPSKIYLVKGDAVCIDKIENGKAFCTYFGKKTTKGWLNLSELNKI